MDGGKAFIELRDRLLGEAISHEQALQSFHWPAVRHFNWATDYFDRIALANDRPALRVIDGAGGDSSLSFAALARRSNQVAHFLTLHGVRPGDRVLIMLGNVVALWETMLATIKLGAVMIPATTLLQREDLEDRLTRGNVRADPCLRGWRGARIDRIRRQLSIGPDIHRHRADISRRTNAAVFHLGNHGQAQAGRAFSDPLPGRASVHGLLDWTAAR